jgi:chemotaxis protein methyltransferase CheR
MREIAFSPQLYTLFRSLVEEQAGLHYRAEDFDLFGEKVETRALELGFESLLDYYYFLRYDPEGSSELDKLIEALVVQETYFFREMDALEVALERVVVPAVERQGRARVWSAACSTGEEPLTVAMLLDGRGLLGKVEIFASDISEKALQRARAGRFRPRALRGDGLDVAARYLERRGDGLVIDPRMVEAVDFRRVNLMFSREFTPLGLFDLVLCRNVLIYFSDEMVVRLIGELARSLTATGRLLVGVSESLLRFTTELACEEQGGVFLYRRQE